LSWSDDYRLYGLRGCVVVGTKFEGEAVDITQMKRFGNLLFI
jgi:hypothetical protein